MIKKRDPQMKFWKQQREDETKPLGLSIGIVMSPETLDPLTLLSQTRIVVYVNVDTTKRVSKKMVKETILQKLRDFLSQRGRTSCV